MSTEEHQSALQIRHAELEGKLVAEMAHPNPDTGIIADIKKQKLRIKDKLADLVVG
jgi:hypothetical protein